MGEAASDDSSLRVLRLTFRVNDSGPELISTESIEMLLPGQLGDRPRVGDHAGHWFELRDAQDNTLAHRVIDSSVLGSIELPMLDGKIERGFGPRTGHLFEVLLPDDPQGTTAVLVGNPRRLAYFTNRDVQHSAELARYDISARRREGGNGQP